MKRRFVIDRGVLRWAGFFYCAENLTFFSITENWYFLAGNLAHKMAESAILTGDVFPAVSTTGTLKGKWNE